MDRGERKRVAVSYTCILWGKKMARHGRIRFRTIEEALEYVEEFADGLESNVPITLEDDNTYMFFGHGKKIARWICGDKEDDLEFHGIFREPRPTKGYLKKTKYWKE